MYTALIYRSGVIVTVSYFTQELVKEYSISLDIPYCMVYHSSLLQHPLRTIL